MPEQPVPDPFLMAQLQNSERPIEWAAGLVKPWQHERVDDEWSAHQHLFHLLATENQVYHPRIEEMLKHDGAKFLYLDSPGFMASNYRKEPSIEELAAQFADARARTVELLRGAGQDDWIRKATWPDGTQIDLAWFAEKALWHGLDHLASLLDVHGEFEPQQAPRWLGRTPKA